MTVTIVIPLLFFAGQLLARFGARVMLVVGGVVMTTGLVIFASSTGNATFYLAAALLGLGYGLSAAHSGRFDQQLVCRQTRPRPRHRARRVRCWRRDLGGNRPLSPPRHSGGAGIQIMAVAMAICTVLPALFLIRGQPRRRRVAPVRRGRNTSRRAGG